MMRRLAAGVAAAAMGATVLAGAAAPAMADPGYDSGQTRLDLDVNPEPAWRGKPLTVEGKLSVHCDEDFASGLVVVLHDNRCKEGSWHRLGWKRIVILFKPSYSGRWEYVDTLKTGRDGYFHTRVEARSSGTWRAVFEGSRHLEPSSDTDWVKVYGRHHHR
ncbi:hypothetical protein ACBI99_31510 [Nonomuraea sp. ATR24]|uniref:hypothetical protein n=1 Tax=Nonomuraea TaxID=83681 RepID=UPI001C5D6120|nr:hypothetical protein [Nonomuraea ceibae]